MRKRIKHTILIGAFALILTACGTKDKEKPEETTVPVETPVETPIETEENNESTNTPEVTEEIEETKEPEVTKEAEGIQMTEEPEATKEAEKTSQPEETEQPKSTKKPVATKQPITTKKPQNTKKPASTTKPTKQPTVTKQPIPTKRPAATLEPEATKKPSATKEPMITEKPQDSVSVSSIHTSVKNAYGDQYTPNMSVDDVMLKDTFGVSPEWCEEYVGEIPMINVQVDTFLAVKAKDGKKSDIEKALKGYQNIMKADTMQYPINQLKIKASKVISYDDYVFFIMLGNVDNSNEEEMSEEDLIKEYEKQNDIAIAAIKKAIGK